MSPIEVSENPRRANSFRLASRIFVLARGSPRRGRVIFGASQGDWSGGSHRRAYPKRVTGLGSSNLFRKLVPALAVADPGAQLPAPRLRDLIQLHPQAAQPFGDQFTGAEAGQLQGKSFAALAHHLQRPPQSPIRSGETGDVS